MTRQVSFYITQFTQRQQTFEFCYKLLKKITKKGHAATIITDDPVHQSQLSAYLWHKEPTDWLPINQNGHLLTLQGIHQHAPTLIINLSQPDTNLPDDWQHYLLIVPQDGERLHQARQQFKHYQQLGYTMNTHKIG